MQVLDTGYKLKLRVLWHKVDQVATPFSTTVFAKLRLRVVCYSCDQVNLT